MTAPYPRLRGGGAGSLFHPASEPSLPTGDGRFCNRTAAVKLLSFSTASNLEFDRSTLHRDGCTRKVGSCP
jgi:hypothetical protein